MLPEEVTRLIGKVGDPVVLEVEKGAVKKFADAVGDRNPLYWDEEYARNSKYGSIVAPPGFFGWPLHWTTAMPFFSPLIEELIETIIRAGYPRLLDGGVEFEFFAPVRAGDILVWSIKIADIYERESKGTTLVFAITENSYINQNGKLVAVMRSTLIAR